MSNEYGSHTITKEQYITVEAVTGYEDELLPLAAVYPNPTNGQLNLSFSQQYIYERKILSEEMITGKTGQIDISSYPSGIYLITVENGKQKTTMRIVKSH